MEWLQIVATFLGLLMPLSGAVLSFYLTKRAELSAKYRQEKMELYVKYINIVMKNDGIQQMYLAAVSNQIYLTGSLEVVIALNNLNYFFKKPESEYPNFHADSMAALRKLIIEMRKELYGKKEKEDAFPNSEELYIFTDRT